MNKKIIGLLVLCLGVFIARAWKTGVSDNGYPSFVPFGANAMEVKISDKNFPVIIPFSPLKQGLREKLQPLSQSTVGPKSPNKQTSEFSDLSLSDESKTFLNDLETKEQARRADPSPNFGVLGSLKAKYKHYQLKKAIELVNSKFGDMIAYPSDKRDHFFESYSSIKPSLDFILLNMTKDDLVNDDEMFKSAIEMSWSLFGFELQWGNFLKHSTLGEKSKSFSLLVPFLESLIQFRKILNMTDKGRIHLEYLKERFLEGQERAMERTLKNKKEKLWQSAIEAEPREERHSPEKEHEKEEWRRASDKAKKQWEMEWQAKDAYDDQFKATWKEWQSPEKEREARSEIREIERKKQQRIMKDAAVTIEEEVKDFRFPLGRDFREILKGSLLKERREERGRPDRLFRAERDLQERIRIRDEDSIRRIKERTRRDEAWINREKIQREVIRRASKGRFSYEK